MSTFCCSFNFYFVSATVFVSNFTFVLSSRSLMRSISVSWFIRLKSLSSTAYSSSSSCLTLAVSKASSQMLSSVFLVTNEHVLANASFHYFYFVYVPAVLLLDISAL